MSGRDGVKAKAEEAAKTTQKLAAHKIPDLFCSRCKSIDQHKTSHCTAPRWPNHNQQWCDRCADRSSEHDAKTCPIVRNPRAVFSCKKCGHEGHHNTQNCPLNPQKPDDLIQFIPSKYKAVSEGQKKNNQTAASTQMNRPSNETSSFNSYRAPGPSNQGRLTYASAPSRRGNSPFASSSPLLSQLPHAAGRAGFYQATTSSYRSTSNKIDDSDKPETRPIEQANIPRPPISEKERRRLEWEREPLAAVPTSTLPRPEKILTNFFEVSFPQKVVLYKYRIKLGKIGEHDIKKPEVIRALIKKLLHVQRTPAVPFVSDYHSYVISVGKLYPEFSGIPERSYKVPHLRSPRSNESVAPTLDTIFWDDGPFSKEQLRALCESTLGPNSKYHPDEDMRALNIISWVDINEHNSLGGQVGKKFFPGDFSQSISLYSKVYPRARGGSAVYQIGKGFFTSMRPGEGRVYLNVNPATSAFYPEITIQTWIESRWGPTELLPPAGKAHELKGLRVTFLKDKIPKKRVIFELDLLSDIWPTFTKKEGSKEQKVSVKQHFKDEYQLNLINTCIVNVGNAQNPKWYPASSLVFVPWQPVRHTLEPCYTDSMLRVSKKVPKECRNTINSEAFGPGALSRSKINNFGIKISDSMTKIDARYLRPPVLSFTNNQVVLFENNRSKASWQLGVHSREGQLRLHGFVHMPNTRLKCGIIKLGSWHGLDESRAQYFRAQLRQILSAYGFNPQMRNGMLPQEDIQTPSSRSDLVKSLDDVFDKSFANADIIMILLSDKNQDTYADIKWWGDCIRGIPTVCVTKQALEGNVNSDRNRINESFSGNICLKINAKLRGTSHHLLLKQTDKEHIKWHGARPKTMLMGADVTHPNNKPNKSAPSIAGVVATQDADSGHYLASARLQPNNTEYIASIKEMVLERLLAYLASNKELPSHILFYRDGVGESQVPGMVMKDELPLIRQACQEASVYACMASPLITLLVATKRHHARFYPEDDSKQSFTQNLQSGLVVDTQIMSPKISSFYLQSHSSPLGTARSTLYIVVVNESNYTMDELQEITNLICYTGSRATNSLSVCTPAKYADLLCTRLAAYMRPELNTPRSIGEKKLSEFAHDPNTWNTSTRRANPWHSKMDGIMFYL